MMNPLVRQCAPLLLLTLSACATPQAVTRYYTLMPDASAPASASNNNFQIELMPVEIPMQVDVPQIVARAGNGELVPVDSRRWIAPLSNELRHALSWQLTRSLGVRDVAGLGRNNKMPIYRIHLRVQRFDSVPGSYARIDALWSIRTSPIEAAVATCSSSASVAATADYANLVQGHQQALSKIATDIAKSIRDAQTLKTAIACP